MNAIAPSYTPNRGAGPVALNQYGSNAAGILLVCLYVFLIVSRVLDVSPIWFLHIPLILLLLLIIVTLARGQFRIAFRSKITIYFAAFTAWVVLCFPSSEWRSASVGPIEEQLQAFAIFLIVAQMVRTHADWRRLAAAYAYAILVAGVLGFYLARFVEGGRLALKNGSLADPNEFALTIIVGLPFLWYTANAGGVMRKVFFLLGSIPVFITLARTGSRSGLFALGAVFVTVFFLTKGVRKLVIAFAAVVLVLAAAVFLPDYLKARYFTIFSPADAGQLDVRSQEHLEADISSSEGRKMLLIQSIHMTFEHPLFGVGPGVFSYASWDERHASGNPAGLAQVTHNTYTQISSETGLPGFLLFAITLFFAVKYTFADYRAAARANSGLAKSGKYLLESFAGLSVGIFFLSVGYTHTLAVLFALAVSLHNVTEQARISASESGNTPAPEPSQTHGFLPAPARLRPTYLGSRGRTKVASSTTPPARR